jgi:O-antigen/teichoic acid export membrane protein
MTATTHQGGTFAKRVTAVFSTKLFAFSMSFATSIVVSRILGTDGKGQYVAVIAVPALLGGIGVFGLPNAINYFSARGISVRGLLRAGLLFTTILSAVLMTVLWVLLPWLHGSILSGAPVDTLRIGLITVPAALLSTFGSAVLYGRQQIRTYSTILVAQAFTTFTLAVLFVGVFRWGVLGAVAASIIVTWLLAIAVVVAVARLSGRTSEGGPVSYRALMRYGSRIYPSSITGYFNYRVDVFIIQALMVGQSGQLGLYSMAVTMAELLFYVPDSVTMIFLPRVSGSTPAEADALMPRVARLTVLITCLCAVALIPAAYVGIHLVLPTFAPCLPAFLVLLPGVVSIALAKVMTSYIAGRGRPGPVSAGATVALFINVVANLILIPQFGIVGAAMASLISYSALAVMMVVVACRLSNLSPLTIVVPGKAEVRLLWSAAGRAVASLRARLAGRGRGAAANGAAGGIDSGTPS